MVHSSSGRYGADRQLGLIATGLDRDRYEPIVALPGDGPLADDLRGAGIEVLIRPLSVVRRSEATAAGLSRVVANALHDGVALGSLLRRRGVALVHSNTSVVLGGAAAAATARVPHVWHVREIYSRFPRAWPAFRRLLMTADALPCVSRAARRQFVGRTDRARVIYDGLAIEPRRAPRSSARAALGLHPDRPVIGLAGRISDWKGQDVLVRALAESPLRERDAIGLLAGEPWPGDEDRLRRVLSLAERLAVGDRLRVVGFRDDVEAVYGACDLIAVPSTAPDPLPGAAIEAAAAGCAVIASNTGGLAEILADHGTGRLFPAGDAHRLALIAAELLDDPAERERLGEAAARDARARFAPGRLIAAVHALYDDLLPAPGTVRGPVARRLRT